MDQNKIMISQSQTQCFIMNVNTVGTSEISNDNTEAKPIISKEKIMSYEEKSVGTTAFFKCEACPYMALAEDDMKFHLFTVHPELAKTNGLADNIRIPCPGCTSVFEAEETLRTHLRNHHKMGFKDVKKMVKSLVQIALKDAKLKKEPRKSNVEPAAPVRQEVNDFKIPPIIELVPNIDKTNESLPKGVRFISVDELQQMSLPSFEKIDPKNMIEEASINILYTNEVSTKCPSSIDTSTANISCSALQVSNVTPDLISSIQPHSTATMEKITLPKNNPDNICDTIPSTSDDLPKNGRQFGSRTMGITEYKKHFNVYENEITKEFGERCSISGCYVRLKNESKLMYHRSCHREGTKELHCPECSMVFAYVEPLHTHLWKGHSIDMELPTCDICGYKTYKRYRLKNIHMKIHEETKDYKCEVCSSSFKTSNQLSKHRLVHKERPAVQCPLCQLQLPSARRLRHHLATAHDKLRPYKCPHCDYTATRKVELTLHVRSHTADKRYSCEACGYRTADHNALRRHKKRHSGRGLYKCKHCPYTCIQSNVLTSHLIGAHPDLHAADLFKCPYCSYRSISRDKYVSHLGGRHADHEGVQLLIELQLQPDALKPSWTIPSADRAARPADRAAAPPPDTAAALQYGHAPPLHADGYDDGQLDLRFLNPTGALEQAPTQASCDNADGPAPLGLESLIDDFPAGPPPEAQLVSGNLTLQPAGKIPPPATKAIGPIIKPTQILPVPAPGRSPGGAPLEPEAPNVPRKKPKISVKSNLILKGPDRVSTFHSQQKMAFERLEDDERFGLSGGGPVAFDDRAPAYIKLEATIKQNTQSPGPEGGGLAPEYGAPPPPARPVKDELRLDAFFAPPPPLMDQYLLDGVLGRLDPPPPVIEIDDNSDDDKLLPRFDVNFPLDSLYSMHNDFYFLEGEAEPAGADAEPDLGGELAHARRDPVMNTSVLRGATNKINVKNIESMKN